MPSSLFLVILMPSSRSGSPKSSISKLPLILLIISSIYAVVFDANNVIIREMSAYLQSPR